MPEIAKTPSRGPLTPLYGGKGSVLRGAGELKLGRVTVQPDGRGIPTYTVCSTQFFTIVVRRNNLIFIS